MLNNFSCQVLVQNDEFWLPYALKSMENFFNTYVIYDVGSQDNTENIIDWFVENNKHSCEFFVRKLPDCSPEVQGTFRNAMITEGNRDYYFILDGDEVYSLQSLIALSDEQFEFIRSGLPYGVIHRKEFSSDLLSQYDEIRTHHRLYKNSAFWKGTHPGEEPVYEQRPGRNEFKFPHRTMCYHFHNAERSRFDAQKRKKRKTQKTYHPGNLIPVKLLEEVPILRKPIHTFQVAPALERLQYEFANN